MHICIRQQSVIASLTAIVLLLVLIACGGGGGGGSDAATTPSSPSPKSWGVAELIETDNVGWAVEPQIAFDGAGNAIAVWSQSDGTRYNIWANYFNGTSWGTAELIETDNLGGAREPQIAFDGAGKAIAVWHQSDGTRMNIWANYFNGTAWGSAGLIETDDTGAASHPQIAMDAAGNAFAVWDQSDGTRYNIWANYRDSGNVGTWGAAHLIESNNTANAYNPQIAFDGGHAIAVWNQSAIYANRFNGAVWDGALQIDSLNGGSYPQIAFDGAGNAIAVWTQLDGPQLSIWANYYDGTTWGTAEVIETDNAGGASAPQITFDNTGNAIAVWYQSDGTRSNIWANYFDGTSWGTAELIETEDTGDAEHPQIAIDAFGNAFAVWEQPEPGGTRSSIWANYYDGTAWGTAEVIETDDTGYASFSQIAFDDNGNAIAVWMQYDGVQYSIYANRFE